MTSTTWLEESGSVDGPILITNTHSVGVVRDAFISWLVKNQRTPATNSFKGGFWSLPIVAETYDGFLNDINGFHVKPEHVFQALDGARAGPVAEGNVGGGTGMICFGYKGGIGTASRVVQIPQAGQSYRVAALVQCNCGSRNQLRISGVPAGDEIPNTAFNAKTLAENVNERGSTLSVGQRQLINFARALAHNPRFLILDEATSSVDTKTELLIREALNRLLSGRTALVIAHRLSTIQHADRILVFHKGRLREQGAHQELLAQRGIYYRLYQLQYKEQELHLPLDSSRSAETSVLPASD